MPKKKAQKKKVDEKKNVIKKPELSAKIPVVNGVQTRLGWKRPYSNNDNNYYMPREEYDEKTRSNFSKLLKERFGLNLEADPADAARRIFCYNKSGRGFLDQYQSEMEELDLMPDCREKFQKKAACANELERGLFYEMAKGSLAIIPLGESEPRQVLCDTDKSYFTISEPLSMSNPDDMLRLYSAYETKPLSSELYKPHKPTFNEKEPKIPDPPEPFTMKAPGPKPQPPKLRAFTMKQPVLERDILEDRTRDDLYKEVYDKMFKSRHIVKPELNAEPVKDPGKFTEPEPDVPVKHDYGPLPKEPEKPAGYDEAKCLLDQLEASYKAVKPKRDPRFQYTFYKPAPFTKTEPKKPVLDLPGPPVPPAYKDAGKPKPKYRFYEPVLRLRKPYGMEDPGADPPGIKSHPKEPKKPELRDEPVNPGGAKRFFRWLSKKWRDQIADHDAWERERDALALPETYDKYNKDHRAWKAECDRIDEENRLKLSDYQTKKMAWDEAMKELEPDNMMIRMEYESRLKDHKNDKALLGDKFEEAKAAYEKQVADWEKENKEHIDAVNAENKKLREAYDKECDEFDKIEKEFNLNYYDCKNDPQKMKLRRQELQDDYDLKLKEYKDAKEQWNLANGKYEEHVQGVYEKAVREGRDPQKDVEDYKKYMEQEQAYDQTQEALSNFVVQHPVLGEYETDLSEYEQEVGLRQDAEEAHQERMEEYEEEHGEWKAKKDEYDAALAKYETYKAAIKDFKKAEEDYNASMDKLKRDAERETDRLIRENAQARADFPNKLQEYQNEKLAYDNAYWNWKQGCYDMEKPGGLIYKWEENVKKYDEGKKAYELEKKKYDEEVKKYPQKLKNYNINLDLHIKSLEKYNLQMENYKRAVERRDEIRDYNDRMRTEHWNKINADPKYMDYSLNRNFYNYGHKVWSDQLKGNYNAMSFQGADVKEYEKQQKKIYADYEKAKSKAPVSPSGEKMTEYYRKVLEHDYVSKFPKGMQPYMREVYAQGKAVDDDLEEKFRKNMNGMSLDEYKKASVDKMYNAVVRDAVEKHATSTFLTKGTTSEIDKFLSPKFAEDCKKDMMKNKKLMTRIEDRYNIYKASKSIGRSLNDEKSLKEAYRGSYSPDNPKEVMKDPIFGEVHGTYQALENARKSNPQLFN